MSIDMNKVEAFAGQLVTDIGATFSGVMSNIGHKLGLIIGALRNAIYSLYIKSYILRTLGGQQAVTIIARDNQYIRPQRIDCSHLGCKVCDSKRLVRYFV